MVGEDGGVVLSVNQELENIFKKRGIGINDVAGRFEVLFELKKVERINVGGIDSPVVLSDEREITSLTGEDIKAGDHRKMSSDDLMPIYEALYSSYDKSIV